MTRVNLIPSTTEPATSRYLGITFSTKTPMSV